MQTVGAVQGAGTVHRRKRRNALLATAVIASVIMLMALLAWSIPFATNGIESETAVPGAVGAGSAVIHDDPGNVHRGVTPGYAIIHDDAGNVSPHTGEGPAIIHDDAGNVNR